ncbi:FkbM family methyltransferase [Ruegeria sp. PrR005]|uniref:FkbM family methyltransferase n=1 Tax=Ruegeria sp. PrR005 TaxID=2706882 RepID=A0A6B2NZ36_9RHOB|nr:FkbM family methyltransferase [Ruegeria sp. PrR005]NDW47689.1 FkbM family methyltransferase [Ruegeria sp. PrR005]
MLTRIRKMIYRARGYVPGRLNGEPFRLDPYHSKFWRKVTAGGWEPETFAVLDRHLSPDRDYVDIGAWIGPTVLYAARRARHVWCFEPDPVALRHLLWNLELNAIRNVSAFGVALSDGFGLARMASFGGEAGDSMTSLLASGNHGSDALTIGWDQFAQTVDLSGVSLVKMDVEGAEFGVVPTLSDWLRTHRPAFYLSTHAPFLEENARAGAMAGLARNLDFYARATDEAGAPADLAAPEAQSRFCSFLFNG